MTTLRYWLPVLLLASLIVFASSDRLSSEHTATWIDYLLAGHVSPTVLYVLNVVFRKSGHIAAYGLLGGLAFRAARGDAAGFATRWAVTALSTVIVVSTIDEVRQSFTRFRTGTPYDVVLDSCAALLVILVIRRLTPLPDTSS